MAAAERSQDTYLATVADGCIDGVLGLVLTRGYSKPQVEASLSPVLVM